MSVRDDADAMTTRPGDVGLMRSILQRIATGPELSKDISREEARAGMRSVLDGQIDPVQAGIFLIALRMKRESDDELRGILDALRETTATTVAPVDELLDIGDPYDGYARSLPVAPFLPAVLAACGTPAVSHGVETLGPKYGVTHRQVLRAAGMTVDLSMAEAAARVADPGIGWCYVDQRVFAPKLHALAPLRSLIVKRPALTTIEVLLGALRGRWRTHLATGYVHKAYPRVYALLARHAGFDSALLVRGVEGGVIPSLRQEGKYFSYQDKDEEQERRMTPADFGWNEPLLPPPLPPGAQRSENDPADAAVDTAALAQAAAEAGRYALAGGHGPARDNLIAAAALSLYHLAKSPSLLAAANTVRAVLDSGRAKTRFDAARA